MKKETVQYRAANGLCTRCGKPAVENRKMCAKHLEESRLKEKNKRERRKHNNKCVRCGSEKPRVGKTQCDKCANLYKDKYNAAKMDKYYQRRSACLCVRCGVAVSNSTVHCDTCAEYMRQKDSTYYHMVKESGMCVHCRKSRPIDGETLCRICKEKNAVAGKDNRNKQKFTVIDRYGGKCCRCGETDRDVLAIDHIHGGGGEHRRELKKNGTTTYRWLIKNGYPDGFQVLCFNCNMKKRIHEDARKS